MSLRKGIALLLLLFVVAGFAYAEDATQPTEKPVAKKKVTPIELMKKYSDYLMVTKSGGISGRIGQQIQVVIQGGVGNQMFSSFGAQESMAVLVSDDLMMFPHSSSSFGGGMVVVNGGGEENEEKKLSIKVHLPNGKDITAEPIGSIKKQRIGFAHIELPENAGVKKLTFGPTNISLCQQVFIIGRRKAEWKHSMFYLRGEINGKLPLKDKDAFSVSLAQELLSDEALGAIVVDIDGNYLGMVHEFSGKILSVGVVNPDFFAKGIKKAIETPDELDPFNDPARNGMGGFGGMMPPIPPDDPQVDEAPKPFLGISVKAIDEKIAKEVGLEEATGLLISTVGDDTPAAKGGLKVGDVILEADGLILDTPEQLKELISKNDPGNKMEFVIFRDGKQFSLTVTLAKR